MHGVLKDSAVIAIPRSMYFFYTCFTIFPIEAIYSLIVFMGADKAFADFRPNRPNQK